jgi:predicted nucleic acid-binding Zn finger protein
LQASAEQLKRICEKVRGGEGLDRATTEELSALFGERASRALEAIQTRKVKKYDFLPSGRTRWIVVGRSKEYMVLADAEYCSCEDFYYLVVNGIVPHCYHVLAQKIAEALGRYDLIREDDEMYDFLSREW